VNTVVLPPRRQPPPTFGLKPLFSASWRFPCRGWIQRNCPSLSFADAAGNPGTQSPPSPTPDHRGTLPRHPRRPGLPRRRHHHRRHRRHALDWIRSTSRRRRRRDHDDHRPIHDPHHLPPGSTPADKWVQKAVAAEQHFGSVHVVGKISQGESDILLELLVNSDGEGGGEFVQNGNLIKIERVGPLLYFNAPTKFWATHATAAQTKVYGGKWIEFSAVDERFTSFDQFLDAADLAVAAFPGHTAPLTLGRPTTFAGHKVVVVKDMVVSNGKQSTGLMDIAANGPPWCTRSSTTPPAT
jgi:hypothetical protein